MFNVRTKDQTDTESWRVFSAGEGNGIRCRVVSFGLSGRYFLVLCSVFKRILLEEGESCYLYVFVNRPVTCGSFSSLSISSSYRPDSVFSLCISFFFLPGLHFGTPSDQQFSQSEFLVGVGSSRSPLWASYKARIKRHVGRNANYSGICFSQRE